MSKSPLPNILDFIPKSFPHLNKLEGTDGPLRDFVRFLHACSDDELTRCQTATAIVLTLWQSAGPAWSYPPPSVLLVNAGMTPDPIDAVVRDSTGWRDPDPEDNEGYYKNNGENRNRELMISLAREHDLWATGAPEKLGKRLMDPRQLWKEARENSFGLGRAGQYARMWHPELGLMTDDSDHIILRLERDIDHAMFHEHALKTPIFIDAAGRGPDIDLRRKFASVSGSLIPDQWPAEMLQNSLYGGFPMVYLPHAASAPLTSVPELWRFDAQEFGGRWNTARLNPRRTDSIQAFRGTLPHQWCRSIENAMRRRLRRCPAAGEFFYLRIMRELGEVCARIALFLGKGGHRRSRSGPPTSEEIQALGDDLHKLTVRGIALGVESFTYHGYGLEVGFMRDVISRLLKAVRERGEISRRDLQRKLQSLNAAELDRVLEILETEGLVTLAGRKVAAVSIADFVRSLAGRSDYFIPELDTTRFIDERK